MILQRVRSNMDESSLSGKKIVLGITGSIAAYKAAELVRRMREVGAHVKVVMTKGACEFITPLTLQTLSGQPVALELLDADQESAMGHIALARWADWIVIAPASADVIARLTQGRTDDLLSALCLASESPLAIVPAMNNKMWTHQATQANVHTLMTRGVHIIGPASGEQACGEQGEGRMMEPLAIINELSQLMMPTQLQGKKVVITAGPTYEAIDPVRFMGNRSSGKMGFSIAKAAREAGAEVTLIAGPVHLTTPTGVQRIDVESAQQMFDAVMEESALCDIFIGCAAVADYRPAQTETQKIKKTDNDALTITLLPTLDIVSTVARLENKPFVVGFAAETQHVADFANQKLSDKQLDMIAANHVGQGRGFAVDDNALAVFWTEGSCALPLAPKPQLARQLMTVIIERFYAKNTT